MSNAAIHTLIHDSAVLGRKKRLFAIVPERAASERLPVCYYLHGWGGTAEAFLNHPSTLACLRQADQVSVFPECFRNWFINDHQGNRYEDYLAHEVIATAERAWLPDGCSQRSIAGFSMGGLSALCMAFRHPHLFDGVACFAGAFEAPRRVGDPYAQFRDRPDLVMPTEKELTLAWGEPGSDVRNRYDPYLALAPQTLREKQLYISIGTRDFERMIAMNRRFRGLLVEAQLPHRYEELPCGHDMEIVAASLPGALEHLRMHSEAA
jgi:putative tributyrin esterase